MTNEQLAAAIEAAASLSRTLTGEGQDYALDQLRTLMTIQLERASAPPADPDPWGPMEQRPNSTGVTMRAIAQENGIDLEKELGPHDPRASIPMCVHNRLMPTREQPGEDCELCAGKDNGAGAPDPGHDPTEALDGGRLG